MNEFYKIESKFNMFLISYSLIKENMFSMSTSWEKVNKKEFEALKLIVTKFTTVSGDTYISIVLACR